MTQQVEFGGAGIFYRDKLLGWLSPDETRGLAWVRNDTKSTVISVEEPSHPGRYVSVEMDSVSTNIITYVNNGNPSVTFEINGSGSITEEDAGTSLSMNEFKKVIAGLAAQKIVNDISAAFGKIQKTYKSDVLGLASYIHGQHNNEWESVIKQRWQQIYPELPITVSVSVTINDSTLFQIPMQELQKY
jgi:spore germination protein KC